MRFRLFGLLFLFLLPGMALAQTDSLSNAARALLSAGKGAEAAHLYRQLYAQDPSVYPFYLDALILAKNYSDAEKLVTSQPPGRYPVLQGIDLGRILLAQGKDNKAREQWDAVLAALLPDDALVQQMAGAFSKINQPEYAIRVYEQATILLRNPYFYSAQLARLYADQGDVARAAGVILEAAPGQPNGLEDSKGALLELLANDHQKLVIAQKAVIKKINQQPDNPYFTELLTWLFTLKGDWSGALVQIRALDERNREDGRRLLEFADRAAREGQYDIAIQALGLIMEKGQGTPLYGRAEAFRLQARFEQLQNNPAWTEAEAVALAKDFKAYLDAHPEWQATDAMRDYARLLAQYAGDPQGAITALRHALESPGVSRQFRGAAKLQMGDYQALTGDVWEASLTYSQVDKDFREDAMGEEARFRNARLAYYRGDFDWAQGQLSVLKASTSELISNDAMYLAVLITENTPDDSNWTPLRRFAYADMLVYQNRNQEAEKLLDSLTTAFPKHALADDILMLRARLAQQRRDWTKALGYLADISKDYGKDVLGDDAVYQSAVINQKYLNNLAEAKRLYEELIIQYPGSTYVQVARAELARLNKAPES